MSDRFYTTVKVSGPSADAAAKAAMEAILNQPKDSRWDGGWVDDSHCGSEYGPEYVDHDSGQGVVIIATEVSRKFPTETFHLFVNGDYGAGVQGPVRIQNGAVTDGRTEECSYGGPYDTSEYITAMAPFKEAVPTDAVLVRMSPEQLVPYLKATIRELERMRERKRPIDMAEVLGQ